LGVCYEGGYDEHGKWPTRGQRNKNVQNIPVFAPSGHFRESFCTNEGSGMGSSVRFIKKLCPGANVDDGMPIHGAEAQNTDRQAQHIANLAQE